MYLNQQNGVFYFTHLKLSYNLYMCCAKQRPDPAMSGYMSDMICFGVRQTANTVTQ